MICNPAANDEDVASMVANNSVDSPNTATPPSLCFTVEQHSIVNLMKILSDIDAPDRAFGSIMKWAKAAHDKQFHFDPKTGHSLNNQYRWMRQLVANSARLLPSVIPVFLGDQKTVDVVVFEFAPTILAVLQDCTKMIQANLAIDIDNPLAKYVPPDNMLGEAMSGTVYQSNFDRFIKDPTKDFVVSLICWFDKSHVTANGKFTLQPYMFTLAIFNDGFWHTLPAWSVMGYMPAFQFSTAYRSKMKPGEFLRGYHKQLDAIFKSYQESEPLLQNVELPIGPNRSMIVNVKCPILFVIQDMEEGD